MIISTISRNKRKSYLVHRSLITNADHVVIFEIKLNSDLFGSFVLLFMIHANE